MWPPKTDCRFGIYIEKYVGKKRKKKQLMKNTHNYRTFNVYGADWQKWILDLDSAGQWTPD